MIYIRTDANEYIATGHMMRCITISNNIKKLGGEVMFVVSDNTSAKLLEQTGYAYKVLDSDWKNPCDDNELNKMRDILSNGKDSVLLLDSYSINRKYTEKLRDYAKIAVIDDLFEEEFCADIIINYSLYHNLFDYKGRYGDTAQLLLGGKYVPLREAFSEDLGDYRLQRQTEPEAGNTAYNVLLICGGGDKENALGGIIDAVVKAELNQRCDFFVVAGAYNPNKEILRKMQMKYENITVYENVSDMAGLMKKCDIAVSAASTVLYECCAMQLPTIFFIVADNQQYDRECFSQNEVMLYAGDMRSNRTDTIKMIVDRLGDLVGNTEKLLDMQAKEKTIVDGKGALRIAEELMKLHNSLRSGG